LLFGLFTISAEAQQINTSMLYRNIESDHYLRANDDNDYFTATDRYYTEGFNFEFVDPGLRKFPLSRLLLHPDKGFNRYGIGVQYNMYTPTDIFPNWILRGNRPYSATMLLNTFLINTDTVRRTQFSSTLTLGILGPGAAADQFQTGVHNALHDMAPHGWENQVHNDAIVSYEVTYEKQLLSYKNWVSFSVDGAVRAGTLNDKGSLGTTLIAGYNANPLTFTLGKKRFRLYAYDHPFVSAVGYDATLEGGWFTKSSPYVISPQDLENITFQNNWGFVMCYHRLTVEYYQVWLSKEFRTGQEHRWGGVQFAWTF
jgi:lipid A 3-O-deacylase